MGTFSIKKRGRDISTPLFRPPFINGKASGDCFIFWKRHQSQVPVFEVISPLFSFASFLERTSDIHCLALLRTTRKPLGNSWGTPGEPLGNRWGTACAWQCQEHWGCRSLDIQTSFTKINYNETSISLQIRLEWRPSV